jgi:hypothetical protein
VISHEKPFHFQTQQFYMAFKYLIIPVILLLCVQTLTAQNKQPAETNSTITLPASTHYYKSGLYKSLWGEHYRKEWHTPVKFFKTNLDTLAGGLIPYETGGGRQTKTIRLRDKHQQEYVLRSIDKSLGKALPEILRGTFAESFANDQVTFSHPYGALVIAPLAEAAGIYHTNPNIYYVPSQDALKTFSDSTGNTLYLFEQRPDENWATAANFGNSKKIISTEDMFKKILEDNDNTIDQKAFVRARLFDMIVGDWGKHEDQWRWASFENGKKTLYAPIPRDRDNVFTKFDGTLLNIGIGMAGAYNLQSYKATIPDPKKFNFSARYLDHHLVNELALADWISIAQDLKGRITDKTIDDAVKNLPPEVYPISGPEITAFMKSRRDDVESYAKNYYLYLSDEVEITGSSKNELLEVKRLSDTETQIQISKLKDKGNDKEDPYYSRIFNTTETKEVRFYGINGNDEYRITGNQDGGIKVRLIGGPGEDKYHDESDGSSASSVLIYDNDKNEVKKSGAIRLRLSNDSSVHAYKYDNYKMDKAGISPKIFYSNEDRIYVGLGYKIQKQKWRKEPFGTQHKIDVTYSFAQKAFSSTYESIFTSLIGKWDLNLFANYDEVRWTNFFGLGNETSLTTKERDFNRVRSQQFIGKIGVQRVFNYKQRITFNPFFQSYDVINDTARYLAKNSTPAPAQLYKAQQYAGAELEYLYQNINDSVLPTKGFNFITTVNYSQNLKESSRKVTKFGAHVNFFLPLSKKFGLSLKAGGTTLTGTPEFYQYNIVGGTETLRGHQRDRFYGTSTAYNQNELRWISDVRSYLYSGKIGLFGFHDLGRVWLKNEESTKWHSGYGAGLILVPFNKIAVSVAYGMSSEDNNIHIRIKKAL